MEHDFGVQDYNQELCQVICARDLESYVRKPWRFANGVEILTPIPTSQLIQAGAYPLCLEGSASDFVGRSGGELHCRIRKGRVTTAQLPGPTWLGRLAVERWP